MTQRENDSWTCGVVKAMPKVVGNRIVAYRYVPVHGCGYLNRPGETHCQECGRAKREEKEVA